MITWLREEVLLTLVWTSTSQVYVPFTDPEPVTLHSRTKNTLRTHVKPSIPYSSQFITGPDGILNRTTVQTMKDSLTRNSTVFSPISHGYNGQAEPPKARVTSNASRETTATSIFSWTAGATSSLVKRTWILGSITKAWKCWSHIWVPNPIISR